MAIITISRQLGSGGDHVASLVASMLGYRLINKQSLLREAQSQGMIDAETASSIGEGKPSFLEHFDEKRIRAFYAIRSIMKELADKDNLVIVGRGGHVELKDYTSMIRIRIIADQKTRLANIMEEEKASKSQVKKLIKENDKQQSEYIKHFFLVKHSDEKLYDLIINTSRISYSVSAGIILQASREVGAMRITPNAD